MARGIFGLDRVYKKQVQNIKDDNFESWPESATYGYFGGGLEPNSPGVQPGRVEKLDFSTEICSLPSNQLSTERRNLAAVSSSSYGYFGGGYALRPDLSPPFNILDTIDRLDFSNETLSVPGNNLTQARYGLAAVSSSSYGYFAGGGSPPTGLIDRIDFSNETTSAPGNDLPLNTWSTSAVSSGSYGYFGGGVSPSPTRTISATVDRLDFSSETFSAPGNNLTQARYGLAAVSSSSYGYFGGGYNDPSPSYFDTIDRIDFSNETTSPVTATLSQARDDVAACSSSSYGYFGGGYAGPPIEEDVATIDRIDFSNETTSAPGNNLTQAMSRLAAVSGGASERIKGSRTYGYFGGGEQVPISGPILATIDRIDFSSETISTPGNNLSQAREDLAACSSSSYGYYGGGENPDADPEELVIIDRIDFSNETLSAPGNNLSEERTRLAACSSSSYGYFGGGTDGPFEKKTIDRLDFSNETLSLPGNNLPQSRNGRQSLAATSSNSYGYFGGGDDGSLSYLDTIDRIDFFNDTVSPPGATLSQGRKGLAAVSSNSYGYFGGGNAPPGVDTIDRIDFSNDTMSLPGNNLPEARSGLGAVSSSSYGYFAGGPDADLDRLDFSNETVLRRSGYFRRNLAALSN